MAHRVLVVEDDDDIRDLAVAALEVAGFIVISASSGQDGLDKLFASSPPPSLILLDLMMPAMNGQTFRNLQRESAEVGHVAVVVVSAHHDLPTVAKEMGALAYVQKPADLRQMVRIVQEHCDALDARAHPIIAVQGTGVGAGAELPAAEPPAAEPPAAEPPAADDPDAT